MLLLNPKEIRNKADQSKELGRRKSQGNYIVHGSWFIVRRKKQTDRGD